MAIALCPVCKTPRRVSKATGRIGHHRITRYSVGSGSSSDQSKLRMVARKWECLGEGMVVVDAQ